MEQTVYLDLFFLINFSMDFLGLFLSAKLLSRHLSVKRSILASVFGGAYACITLMFSFGGLLGLIIDVLACGIIGMIAVLKKRKLKAAAFFSIVYAAVSIVLGGFMTVSFTFFNKIGLDKMFGTDEGGGGISVWLFALLALLSGVASLLGGRFFKKKSSRKEGEVSILFAGKDVRLHAMVDSGNLLKEPISNKACIVADIDSLKGIFPSGIKEMAQDVRGGVAERIRIIPTSSVNGEGMLYAFRADKVRINFGRGWCDVDAYIALSKLGNNADGALALIPSELAFCVP